MSNLRVWVAAIGICAFALPAIAEKPPWAGNGKGKGAQGSGEPPGHAKQRGKSAATAPTIAVSAHFGQPHRVVVRDYYFSGPGVGRCPPGLAKKHNGCLPPGQAKKWFIGRPLPRDVIYYDLPSPLVVQLTPPPAGYRYVRVAADILMIAVGTAMVVDAIEDLGRQ